MTSPIKVWRRQKTLKKEIGKEGVIIAWTMIYVAPKGFEDQVPYPVVLVILDEGKKVFGQLVDYSEEDLVIGVRVQSVLRLVRQPESDSVIPYGIKFTPVNNSDKTKK